MKKTSFDCERMNKPLYMEALANSWGCPEDELIEGKYRPFFGEIKAYSSSKTREKSISDYVRVPITKRNIIAHLKFNARNTDTNSYVLEAIKSARKLGFLEWEC